MWFAIDTLEYLRRGGRIAGAQAWLGSALRIKPILTVESEITPVERVRTSRRAFERMVDLLRSRSRGRRRRVDGPAHPGAGAGRGAGRPRHRALRRRAAGDLGDRARDRHPRRARACSAPAGCPSSFLAVEPASSGSAAAALAPPAPEGERAERGDAAAEHEPGHPAPISICGWWARSCARQSVSLTTSTRSFSTDVPSSHAVLLDRVPDLLGACGRAACGIRRPPPRSTVARIFLASSIAIVGVGAPTWSLRQANRNAIDGQGHQHDRHDQEAEPEVAGGVVDAPGDRPQHEDQREHAEHGADGAGHRPAGDARRLDRHLGLGELDLLADEHRQLLGDLGQRGGDVVVVVSGQGA